MTGKRYQPWSPLQPYLFPPSPLEWLPEGHLAHFLIDVVEALDLTPIEQALQAKDPRGQRSYEPRMLTALLLYAYSTGIFSSRRIERATYEDVAFRVLSAGQHPHFTTVNEFRRQHRDALAGLFEQVLKMCRHAGLLSLGRVALDGTKVQANASKHKAMSYARMQTEEKRLSAEIDELLAKAEETDQREDAELGVGIAKLDIPQELHRREDRRARIQQAKAALEEEARRTRVAELEARAREHVSDANDETLSEMHRKRAANRATKDAEAAAKLRKPDDDDPPGGAPLTDLPQHRVPATPAGDPRPKSQRNFTDGDSRIMVRDGAYVQAFNAHIVVTEAQIIVAHAVTNHPNDIQHLPGLTERCRDSAGELPRELLADAGYFSKKNAAYCEKAGVDAYLSVSAKNKPAEAKLPASAWARMRDKLATTYGKAAYARRKAIVEAPFGQIKEARRFRRFSLRGLRSVRAEWAIVCACHNLLKLFRSGAHARLAAA